MNIGLLTTPARNPGLLVADDELGIREILEVGMRRAGFEIWLASNGLEALACFREHQDLIDVVLMDVRMPLLDGPQTLAALHELDPHMPCCFMSGDLGNYTEDEFLDSGASMVFAKPFNLASASRILVDLANRDRLTVSGKSPRHKHHREGSLK